MAQDRVDKRWQDAGLGKYSTAAILSTLAHYGVAVDEAGFKSLAKDKYPLGIAYEWAQGWKGTGQFKLFPSAAAAELWKRLEEGRTAPGELAERLVEVMTALTRLLQGAADAPVGEAFKKFDALKEKLPQKDGQVEEKFVSEALAYLSEDAWKALDAIAEELAKQGHVDDAKSFAELEEFLMSDRKGVASAVVRAAAGEREPALQGLQAIAKGEEGANLERRLAAIDALSHLGANEPALELGRRLLDDAEKAEDHHVAIGIGQRLYQAAQRSRDVGPLRELEERLGKLMEAHNKAHPHHH
jgi:hypothetical protein